MTPGAMGNDTIDDITSMKIGFKLFHKYGRYAENLTGKIILDLLNDLDDDLLPYSRDLHWCWHLDNPGRVGD